MYRARIMGEIQLKSKCTFQHMTIIIIIIIIIWNTLKCGRTVIRFRGSKTASQPASSYWASTRW